MGLRRTEVSRLPLVSRTFVVGNGSVSVSCAQTPRRAGPQRSRTPGAGCDQPHSVTSFGTVAPRRSAARAATNSPVRPELTRPPSQASG